MKAGVPTVPWGVWSNPARPPVSRSVWISSNRRATARSIAPITRARTAGSMRRDGASRAKKVSPPRPAEGRRSQPTKFDVVAHTPRSAAPARRPSPGAILAGIVLIAAGLRLTQLDAGFSYDEMFVVG